MADEIRDENIVELTRLTIRKVLLEQERKLNAADQKRVDQINAAIKQIENETAKRKAYIQIGNQTLGQVEKEINKKKELKKLYEETAKAIQESGKALKDQAKAIEELQRTTGQRNTDVTIGNIFGALKGFNFGKAFQMFTDAGKMGGLLNNTFKALGGAAGIASATLTTLAVAGKFYLNDVLLPSIQKQNLIGQRLGLGLADRNYFKSYGISDWITRAGFGLSSEQMLQMYSAATGALRTRSFSGTNLSDMYKSIAISSRLWGTDVNTLGTIFRAYTQQNKNMPMDLLAGHFNRLMENVKDTGMTTEEFTEILSNSSMFLKNFGVNLDDYARRMKGYGKYLEEGQLSTKDITAQNMMSADTGKMAFLAKLLQDTGKINLGISSNASPLAMARALKERGLTNAEVTAMLRDIALKPGSQLSGLLSGARNARERELMLAELFSVQLQQLTPYHLVADQMSAASFSSFGPNAKMQVLGGTDETMARMEAQANIATFATGSLGTKAQISTTIVLQGLAKIINILKVAINASDVIVRQFQGNEVPKVE